MKHYTLKNAKMDGIIMSYCRKWILPLFISGLLVGGVQAVESTDSTDSGLPLSWDVDVQAELISNMHGGYRRRSIADGNVHVTATYNTENADLWANGQFTLGFIGIDTTSKNANYPGSLQHVSGIQANSAVQLSDLAYQQKFNENLTVRVGVMDMNSFFNTTTEGFLLLNSAFALYSTLNQNTLVATFPFPGFGAMLEYDFDSIGTQIGIFQGDPQHLDTVFGRGYMAIAEVKDNIVLNQDEYLSLLFKAGAWYYRQPNPFIGKNTYGLYINPEIHWVADRDREYGVFLQWGAAPQKKNLVRDYIGAGVHFKALFEERKEDSLTLGVANATIQGARAETVYEIAYAIYLTKNLNIIPDLQYIIHPRGIYPNAFAGLIRLNFDPLI